MDMVKQEVGDLLKGSWPSLEGLESNPQTAAPSASMVSASSDSESTIGCQT